MRAAGDAWSLSTTRDADRTSGSPDEAQFRHAAQSRPGHCDRRMAASLRRSRRGRVRSGLGRVCKSVPATTESITGALGNDARVLAARSARRLHGRGRQSALPGEGRRAWRTRPSMGTRSSTDRCTASSLLSSRQSTELPLGHARPDPRTRGTRHTSSSRPATAATSPWRWSCKADAAPPAAAIAPFVPDGTVQVGARPRERVRERIESTARDRLEGIGPPTDE